MALSLTYDDLISRVRVTTTVGSTIERSTDGVHWEFVRGAATAVPAGSTVDDFEFGPGVVNRYRDSSGSTATITPNMTNAWLKFVGRPYLNQRIKLTGWDEVSRSARTGVFNVQGRVLPITVSDVHSSRSTTLKVRTDTVEQRDNLDLALSSGLVALLHVPPTAVLPNMYVVPGDYSYSRPTQRSLKSDWLIPVTEVAKPGPGVYGTAATWATVAGMWATWSEVSAANATYADLASVVGSPSEIIVN